MPDLVFNNHSQLKVQKGSFHTRSIDMSKQSFNDCSSEKLIIEDMTVTDISNISTNDDPSLDELTDNSFKCKTCRFTTRLEIELKNHVESEHIKDSIDANSTNEVVKYPVDDNSKNKDLLPVSETALQFTTKKTNCLNLQHY